MKNIISSRLIRFTLRENWLPFFITAVAASILGALPGSIVFGLGGVPIVNIASIGMLLRFLPFAVIPLAARGFGFYMKRSDADFYEALPYTRTQILFSITAALSILSAGMLAVSSVVSILLSLKNLENAIFLVGDSLLILLAYLIACEIAIFATAVAVSMTGHSFNVKVAAFLILLTPRAVINEVASITESSPLTTGTSEIFLDKYNFVTAMVDTPPSLSAYIYSTVLAFLLCVISILLFNRRKSEIASCFYANSTAGHILRVALALPVSFAVVDAILNIGNVSEAESAAAIIFGIIAFLGVYFGYELIAVRSKRAFRSALIGLPIILGINVLVVTIGLSAGAIMDSRLPEKDDISYVCIGGEVYSYDSYTLADYVTLKSSEMRLDAPEAREIIAKALKENTEAYRAGKYEQTYYYGEEKFKAITVDICTKLGEFRRNLCISEADYKSLTSMLGAREEYRELWTALPKEYHTVYHESYSFALDNSEAEQVYKALLRDIEKISFEDWYAANYGEYAEGIVVVARHGGEAVRLRIPVCEATAEAYGLMNELLDQKAEKIYGELVSKIEAAANGSGEELEVSLDVVFVEVGYYDWFVIDDSDEGRKTADFVLECMTSDRATGDTYFGIGVWGFDIMDCYTFGLSDKCTPENAKQFFGVEYTNN